MQLTYQYLGLTPYAEALSLMESKMQNENRERAFFFGLTHPLVYTAGLKTASEHILDSNVQVVSARRGGSVTLHNPGQLVIYTVFPLEKIQGGLHQMVRLLESSMIETLLDLKVESFALPSMSGVFTNKGKIAFIGLGLKKNFIYHGLSMNFQNDLSDFKVINSCGISQPVTNVLSEHPSCALTLEELAQLVYDKIQFRFAPRTPSQFRAWAEERFDFSDYERGLKQGFIFFNEQRYWDAHEIWEMFWRELPPGELRIFFHGLIQTAMAYYKIFDEPNLTGARSLLTKALEKFSASDEIQLIMDQTHFTASLEAIIKSIAENASLEMLRDQIRLTPVRWKLDQD